MNLAQAVETVPGNPNQFWSASEDGSVRQFDKRLRCPRPPSPPPPLLTHPPYLAPHPVLPPHSVLSLPNCSLPVSAGYNGR